MIGLDMVLNMTNKDRAQAIWDRAMGPEAEHIKAQITTQV